MTRGWARGVGVVAVVITAMAIGRLLTDHFPGEDALAGPFVRHGDVGQTVHLRYADVRVTGVRIATTLDGADTVVAAGRFLIVDLAYRVKGQPRVLLGLELWDGKGRRFAPSTRGSTCPQNLDGATGMPMYAMACFDVPRSALPGARFRVALGNYSVNGSDQRRDDLADIDLGITPAKADRMWQKHLTYRADNSDSTRPLDIKPVSLRKPSWWEPSDG